MDHFSRVPAGNLRRDVTASSLNIRISAASAEYLTPVFPPL